jgi:hypothetical protein
MKQLSIALGLCTLVALTARAQTDEAKAVSTVSKGGEHWSAPDQLDLGETTIKPGKRLLFWPEEDQVHEVLENQVTLRFRWALAPGELPFKKRQAFNLAVHSSADPEFSSSTNIQVGADEREGLFEARLPVKKLDAQGQADLSLYLRLQEPQSNLLKIKVRFGRLARVPRIVR